MGQLDNTILCFTTDNGAETITFPDGGTTPFKGGKLSTWEGGMRAPMLVRWPGHIKPGTIKNDIFASLDWVPTFVDIAGGPKGDGLKKKIESGTYPGIVKTTLDGVDQRDYLEGKTREVGARYLLLLFRLPSVGGALQELEDLLRHGVRRPGRLHRGRDAVSLGPGRQHQARSLRNVHRCSSTRRSWAWAALWPDPYTAYLYDWNMLPIGQALWLKELETYQKFPPMQDPASYNLAQVMNQLKKPASARASNRRPAHRDFRGRLARAARYSGNTDLLSLQPIHRFGCETRGPSFARRPVTSQATKPPWNKQCRVNKKETEMKRNLITRVLSLLTASAAILCVSASVQAADKKPNIVMLMQDDTGWFDFGCYGGGKSLGHPTPHVDQLAKEGARFTCWYGQASCTAGRASFITGRIPIRSALSIVVAPGDENHLLKQTPTIAEFFKKNGYTTYFSGKWHLGDKPDGYPIEHGFDEMKSFAAYYPGVYTYSDTSEWFHPWFPSYNKAYSDMYFKIVNMYEWEGVAGQPAKRGPVYHWDYLAEFDQNQTAARHRIHQAAREG